MRTERSRFIADYDNQVRQARLDLGRLFQADDYPSREELLGRFSARLPHRAGAGFGAFPRGTGQRGHRTGSAGHPEGRHPAAQRRARRPLPPPGRSGRARLRTAHRGRQRQAEGVSGQSHREPARTGRHRAAAERFSGRAAQRRSAGKCRTVSPPWNPMCFGPRRNSIPPCAGASSATPRTWRRISRGTSAWSAPSPTAPRPRDGPRDRHRARPAAERLRLGAAARSAVLREPRAAPAASWRTRPARRWPATGRSCATTRSG